MHTRIFVRKTVVLLYLELCRNLVTNCTGHLWHQWQFVSPICTGYCGTNGNFVPIVPGIVAPIAILSHQLCRIVCRTNSNFCRTNCTGLSHQWQFCRTNCAGLWHQWAFVAPIVPGIVAPMAILSHQSYQAFVSQLYRAIVAPMGNRHTAFQSRMTCVS